MKTCACSRVPREYMIEKDFSCPTFHLGVAHGNTLIGAVIGTTKPSLQPDYGGGDAGSPKCLIRVLT